MKDDDKLRLAGTCHFRYEKVTSWCKDYSKKEIQFDSTGGDHLETPVKEIEDWITSINK